MAALRVDRVLPLGEGDFMAEETNRRVGSLGQRRTWALAVLAYMVLLAVCLATISFLAPTWADRASLALAIVGLYGFAFTLISSTLGTLSADFADGMTSPNLRDFLASNLFTLTVAFAVAAAGFQTVLHGGAAEVGPSNKNARRRPRFALLTSFAAALVVIAYSIVHLVFVCPLTYLFYLPGSHFLNVVLAAPAVGRPLMRATDGESAPADTPTPTGTPKHQQRALDVVETLRQNQATFRNLFATAAAAAGALALQVTT
jgi:MFS family permease